MTGATTAQTIRRNWRSPLSTTVLLLGYALWLGLGLWNGALEFRDNDKVVPVRINFSAKQREWVELEGEATLYTLRKDRRACMLVNQARMSIDRLDGKRSALHLLLAADNVVPSASLTVTDEATGERFTIDDLRPYRTEVWVPFSGTECRLRLAPSIRDLRYSIRELRIDDTAVGAGFRFAPRWKLIHEAETHRIEQGSGFHDRTAGSGADASDTTLWMRQFGYLRITPIIKNARRLSLVYRKMLDSYSEPVVWMDRRRAPKETLGWSRRDRGFTSVEVASDLSAPAIVGLQLTDPAKSPSELGINEDPRRLSYEILVESCAVATPN